MNNYDDQMTESVQSLIQWSLDKIEASDDICLEVNAVEAIIDICVIPNRDEEPNNSNCSFYAKPLLRLKKILEKSLNEDYSNMTHNHLLEVRSILYKVKD
jgi:hypothetical protein